MGAKCPLPSPPPSGARALQGAPRGLARCLTPLPAPLFSIGAAPADPKSVAPLFRHLSLAGGRGRSGWRLSPASCAGPAPSGATSPALRISRVSPPPTPAKCRDPPHRTGLCWDFQTETFSFSFFPPYPVVTQSQGLESKEERGKYFYYKTMNLDTFSRFCET